MDGHGLGRAISFAAVMIALCTCPRQGAAASSPEDVLKAHGLKEAGSLYVLESETDIQKKVAEIRQLARKLKWAQTQQRSTGSLEDYQKTMKGLNDEIKGYQSEIRAATQRMNQFPRYRRGYFADNFSAQAYSELLVYRNQLQMELSQATSYLNQLKSQPFDAQSKQKIDAIVREEQQDYDQALLDLRKLVDSTSDKYAALHKDSSIKKALDSLGKTAKVKPKLGPSPHFLANIKLLEKLEKNTASTEAGSAFEDSPRSERRSARSRRGSVKSKTQSSNE